MKAIGFSSSGRHQGNSATLLRSFLEGAASAGAATDLVRLDTLAFRGCLGCLKCAATGECCQRDDLTPLYPRLREARVWALASPVYFDGVCGILKSFYDRLYPFTHPPGKLAGTRAGALIATYEEASRDDYTDAVRRLAGYLGWMGEFRTGLLVVGGLGPADAASRRPDLLARAFALGGTMVSGLAGSDRGP